MRWMDLYLNYNFYFAVPRIQFLAIEITRNREGLNSELRTKFKPLRKNSAE